MNKLTPVEQQALRARAHALSPVVMISEKGLSDTVIKEIDRSLKAHELIKIRIFSDIRSERTGIMETICLQLQATPIQHIGKILVIYRKNPDIPKKQAPSSHSPELNTAKKTTSSRRRTAPISKGARPKAK